MCILPLFRCICDALTNIGANKVCKILSVSLDRGNSVWKRAKLCFCVNWLYWTLSCDELIETSKGKASSMAVKVVNTVGVENWHKPTESWVRLAAGHHSPDWNYAACATANKAMTSTEGKRRKCWKNKEWDRNLKTAGKMTLNNLNYAQWTDETKTHTAMYWNISDQLNEGQFLFYSIIFYTKIKSSFILQVFWTLIILIFLIQTK